jgi:hypothetical protein
MPWFYVSISICFPIDAGDFAACTAVPVAAVGFSTGLCQPSQDSDQAYEVVVSRLSFHFFF